MHSKLSISVATTVAVKNMELAAGKALAFFVLELFGIVGLPPSRFVHKR
jgi:hypothetical protein